MKRLCLIALFLFLTCIPAYSGETTYLDKKYGFSITYPDNYRVLKNYRNIPLIILFPSKGLGIFNNIMVNVSTVRAVDRPLEEIVNIYFKYDKTVSEKKEVLINNIKFISVVQAQKKSFWFFKLNFKLYHLIAVKKTHIYTITYSAPADTYDKYIKEAQRIMQTFAFTEN